MGFLDATLRSACNGAALILRRERGLRLTQKLTHLVDRGLVSSEVSRLQLSLRLRVGRGGLR